ncbi:tetratricopeptide repeat protein [Deinococcus yavapaiensis]|uniref:Tetratricopeptide repeat protein n=1 Tax=Deinococcus yavapaiensis KR-236 TaxID=694435 RepID=A0A318S682_9DEIO|nr:tetratricopeptide repeat protein [Deinococcus yavapaiensis]PYE54403.1 tetratricopeptide repeat protein [Deinococcus yavapaiensis KR-236]
MKRLLTALLLASPLAVCLADVASAQAVTSERWVGWSDAPPATDDDVTAQLLEAAFANRFPNRADVRADFSVIGTYERALSAMSPSDPNYKATKAELDRLRAKAKGNLSGTPAPVRGAVKAVTFAEALNGARHAAYLDAPQKDIDRLANLLQGKTAAQLQGVVATGVLKNRPAIALAALLAAHARDAKNPAHLVNAAGLLSLLGMPYEALSFLDEANKLGTPSGAFVSRAVMLNARGHALLTLGRFADAETALREAVRLDPFLAEAKRNLALALRAQGKKTEAVTYFAAAGRRGPAPKNASTATATPPPAPPAVPGGPSSPPTAPPSTPTSTSTGTAARTLVLTPAHEVYDLSRGRGWKLPSLKYPKNVQDGQAFFEQVKELQEWYRQRSDARMQQVAELQQQQAARLVQARRPSPGDELAKARVYDIVFRITALPFEPTLKKRFALVAEELTRDEGAVNFGGSQFDATKPNSQQTVFFNSRTPSGRFAQAMKDIAAAETPELTACRDSDCREGVRRKYNAMRCPAFKEAHARWRTSMLRLDGAYAELMDPMYRVATGLASNISDPVDFKLARLTAQQEAENLISNLLATASSAGNLWAQYETRVADGMDCDGTAEAEAQPQEEAPEAFECPLTGPYKLKADLKIAELSVNCEKVAVEITVLESELLFVESGGFAELEYAFEGEITLTLGTKAGVGGVLTAGAKSAVYIKVDTSGAFKDFGVKQSTAAGVMLGPVGAEVEIETPISLIPG